MTNRSADGWQSIFKRFNECARSWKKRGLKPYQRTKSGRTREILKHMHLLAGSTVLDIGCNDGLYTALAALHAVRVIGLERNARPFKKSSEFKQALGMNNLTFIRRPLLEFIERGDHIGYGINAIIATGVLYHLDDADTAALKRKLLPVCTRILVSSKENKGKSNNAYHMEKHVNILKFFGKFKCRILGKAEHRVFIYGERP